MAQIRRTGLIQAANTGQIEVVRLLITNHADVNSADKVFLLPPPSKTFSLARGPRPVSVAPTVLRVMHNRGRQDGVTGLNLASQNGHTEVVRLLLQSQADANLAQKVDLVTPPTPSTPAPLEFLVPRSPCRVPSPSILFFQATSPFQLFASYLVLSVPPRHLHLQPPFRVPAATLS